MDKPHPQVAMITGHRRSFIIYEDTSTSALKQRHEYAQGMAFPDGTEEAVTAHGKHTLCTFFSTETEADTEKAFSK